MTEQAAEYGGTACSDCGHVHTPDGCTGEPTASDLWAGVSVSGCDCGLAEDGSYRPAVPRDRAPANYAEQRALLDGSLHHIPPASTPEEGS